MNWQENGLRGYTVSIAPTDEPSGVYHVTYHPKSLLAERGAGGKPKRVPEYKAHVKTKSNEAVIWENAPPVDEEALHKFDQDAKRRADLLHDWLGVLTTLIEVVRTWGNEIGWATKVVDKPMDDSKIGKYRAPALLLQEEATRVLLEPITRAAPGAEGVVDLYLMPSYDDIASLYYYGKKWNVHYIGEDEAPISNIRDTKSKPLTKATLRGLLEEMKSHAE
jgi:hypothetical protein